MITESKSIGIFIDGGYFSKINEALADQLVPLSDVEKNIILH